MDITVSVRTADELSWERLFALPVTDPRPVPAELAADWDRIASRNPWISEAHDPPFNGSRVRICASRYELRRWLEFGNWCNGSAFAIQEAGVTLCFIQQGECSDEWLAVKTFNGRSLAFESISWHRIITRDDQAAFTGYLDDMLAATWDECRHLEYRGAAERKAAQSS